MKESSACGTSFLSHLCVEWENALNSLFSRREIRVVCARLGIVLSSQGGMLKKILPFFKLGLGSRVGSGEQWMSWISLEDLVSALLFTLDHPSLSGVFNFTSPNPLTNKEFTEYLCHLCHKKPFFPIPSWLLKIALGESAQELLLSSVRALPEKLLLSNFVFKNKNYFSI